MTAFWLRCDKCGRCLHDAATEPMQLVGLFKASALGVVAKTHPREQRRRCRCCGFINLFHPAKVAPLLTEYRPDTIVLK